MAASSLPRPLRRSWSIAPPAPIEGGAPRLDPRRLALVAILALSFAFLAGWVSRSGKYPNGAWATGSSDHYSHWSSAILVWHRGTDVWRKPLYLTCPEVPASAVTGVYRDVAPGDVCNIPEREGMRPLVTNWRQFPRPYPPGWALFHAPVAWLHEHTTLSFHALNRIVIVQYLLVVHVLAYVLARTLLWREGQPRLVSDQIGGSALAVRAFVVVLGFSELVRWSMLGYYDGVAVLCSVLGVVAFGRRRDVHAIVWLSLAMFLHFRALWMLPVLAVAALRMVRERAWSSPALLSLGAIMLALSAFAFVLVRPALAHFPVTNPVYFVKLDPRDPERWNLAVPVVVALLVLVHARAWLLATVIAWQLFVLTRTPQMQPWHALSALPILVLARYQRAPSAEVAALAVVLVECRQIFDVVPLPGAWAAAIASS